MNIDLVGLPDIDRIWAQVAPLVVKCIETGPTEVSAGEVWARCRSGEWFVLVAEDGGVIAGVTIWRFAGNHYFECVLLAGEHMPAWLPQSIEAATKLASSNGCLGLAGTCRPGLMKLLKSKYLPRAKVARLQFLAEI